jgi:death-on-curing protein
VRYPTLDEVLALHQIALEIYGGSAGLRDLGALQSSLAIPRQATFGEELYPTLTDKAAILLYFLVQNHPFVDGNKRVALSTCFWFLESNGYTLKVEREELYQFTVDIASGRLDRDSVTAWTREHLRKIE